MNGQNWLGALCIAFTPLASVADVITDLSGAEVQISVLTTNNGGQDFSAALVGSSTAVIGAGTEFTVSLSSGDFGGGSNEYFLGLDFDSAGDIVTTTSGSFFLGAFYFTEFAGFSIQIDFTDPLLNVISATTTGSLSAGTASVTGLDPVNWLITAANTGFSGIQLGFTPGTGMPGLSLEVDAAVVPVPAAVWLFGCGLLGLIGMARRRKD